MTSTDTPMPETAPLFDLPELALVGEEVEPEPEPVLEEPEGYSLLRIWREVLSNIEAARDEDVAIGIAGRIVATWPQLKFQDLPRYHQMYHAILLDIREELDRVISEHPGAADFMESDDMTENGALYKELVVAWNVHLDGLELEWRAEAEDSHITYAAIVDARTFLFSRNGLAGHLEARGFNVPSEEIAEAIQAARGEL